MLLDFLGIYVYLYQTKMLRCEMKLSLSEDSSLRIGNMNMFHIEKVVVYTADDGTSNTALDGIEIKNQPQISSEIQNAKLELRHLSHSELAEIRVGRPRYEPCVMVYLKSESDSKIRSLSIEHCKGSIMISACDV